MFPVIIRQSSVGVSMCPMLAWEREDRGLEHQAGKACSSVYQDPAWISRRFTCPETLDQGVTPKESEAGWRGWMRGKAQDSLELLLPLAGGWQGGS